jgi:serine/threonine-protein kinase Chk2
MQLGHKVLNIVDVSTNGTFVNGDDIKDGLRILKNGDSVWLGKNLRFIVRYAEATPEVNVEDGKEKEGINGADDMEITQENDIRRFHDLYVMGRELGSGHYATVNEATSKRTGEKFAVKIFKPTRMNDVKSSLKFQQELQVLMNIKHDNIVKLIDRFIEPVNKHSISTYLVLEKVNHGELFTRIVDKTQLSEHETRMIFNQLLNGLKYLHDRDIIHRDIKPENILLNIHQNPFQIEVKIADFGLAKFIGELNFTNTLCGTPSYVAPEVLIPSSERKYAKPVDMWSSGVLLYVCLAGFPPFSDELGPPSMRDQILSVTYAFYSPYFDEVDDLALDLISKLLVGDPLKRITVGESLKHPWLNMETDRAVESSSSLMERALLLDGQMPKTYTELSQMSNMGG